MNLSSTIRTAKSIVTANSPVLLVGAAVTGIVTTGILAARGGYKARGILDEESDGEPDTLDLTTKVRLTWLCYVPPVLTGATAIASVVGVHTIHTKRHAALAGLYAMTSAKLDDVQEKAEELLGPKKTQQLRDDLAQKSVDRDNVGDHEVYIVDEGNQLMKDEFSGRYFMGSVPIVEQAFLKINHQLREDGDASVNDLYAFVGLPPVPMGEDFGWSGQQIEPSFGSATTKDGRSAVSFSFLQAPKSGMGAK